MCVWKQTVLVLGPMEPDRHSRLGSMCDYSDSVGAFAPWFIICALTAKWCHSANGGKRGLSLNARGTSSQDINFLLAPNGHHTTNTTQCAAARLGFFGVLLVAPFWVHAGVEMKTREKWWAHNSTNPIWLGG